MVFHGRIVTGSIICNQESPSSVGTVVNCAFVQQVAMKEERIAYAKKNVHLSKLGHVCISY